MLVFRIDLILLFKVLARVLGGEGDAVVVNEGLHWENPLVGVEEVAEKVKFVVQSQIVVLLGEGGTHCLLIIIRRSIIK